MSWDDLLAGLGLGALVALVALRAGKAPPPGHAGRRPAS
jgi:hypothetical protein